MFSCDPIVTPDWNYLSREPNQSRYDITAVLVAVTYSRMVSQRAAARMEVSYSSDEISRWLLDRYGIWWSGCGTGNLDRGRGEESGVAPVTRAVRGKIVVAKQFANR